jgi:hypothetical protein
LRRAPTPAPAIDGSQRVVREISDRPKRFLGTRSPRPQRTERPKSQEPHSPPNFCKYFFGVIEEYQEPAREKIWKSRIWNFHIQADRTRHDEGDDETIHPWLRLPSNELLRRRSQ